MDRLLEVMARLRDPEGGCPWDLQQDLKSLRPYTLEEAYEVVAAIDSGSPSKLREELGDLLLQVVFQARLAEEVGWFRFDDVAEAITSKMIRRHPHVFGDVRVSSPDQVVQNWEQIKAGERESRHRGTLDGVPEALPGLLKAQRVGEKAAAVGFDWQDRSGVDAKVDEELRELQEAIESGDREAIEHELGDLLFALTSLARHLGIDGEAALQSAVRRFRRRFETMQATAAAAGVALGKLGAEGLDALWERAKRAERSSGGGG